MRGKCPLGELSELIVQAYIAEHREHTLVDTSLEEPTWRCIYEVGRGRCRKRVSSVALVQDCAKHQPKGGTFSQETVSFATGTSTAFSSNIVT